MGNASKYVRNVVNGGYLESKNINEITARATGVSVRTVKRVLAMENTEHYEIPTKKKVNRQKHCFDRIDDFTCDLLRCTVYEFYRKGVAPNEQNLLKAMQGKTRDTEYEFPYTEKMLIRLMKSMGFRYRTLERRSTASESTHVIAWRYRYLDQIKKTSK